MDLDKYIKEKYPKGLNYEFTNEEKAGYLAAIEDVKQALSLADVVGSSVTISIEEYEALKRDSDNLGKVSFSM